MSVPDSLRLEVQQFRADWPNGSEGRPGCERCEKAGDICSYCVEDYAEDLESIAHHAICLVESYARGGT
jgi:hypothetical protein